MGEGESMKERKKKKKKILLHSQASKSEYISTHVYRNRRVNPSFTRGSSLERSQRRGFQLSDYYSKLVEQLRSSKTLKVTSLLRGLIPLFFRVNNSTFQRRFLRNLLGLNFFLNLSGPTDRPPFHGPG